MAKARFGLGAIAAALLLAVLGAAPALAGTTAGSAAASGYTNAAFIKAAGTTSIPYAALDFCKRTPRDCAPSGKMVTEVTLTQALWTQLLSVNAYYNTHILPMTDMDQYHVADLWTYPSSGYGDCEDYQLAKQKALIADGWPRSALLMTVVRDENGDGHAVLMVRTDRGDFVLDNESSLVERWDQTPYEFLKRQSQTDPAEWVDLVDTHNPVIVAHR
jgi:predicted transglutaminase-like cysteine proteinase